MYIYSRNSSDCGIIFSIDQSIFNILEIKSEFMGSKGVQNVLPTKIFRSLYICHMKCEIKS